MDSVGPLWTGRPDHEPMDRLLTAQVAAGPWGVGGEFRVDPERAQECIDGLQGAVVSINEALVHCDTMTFPPPGNDPVSVNMAEQAAIMAGRARADAEAWRGQIVATIESLEGQLAAYRANEDEIRLRLR